MDIRCWAQDKSKIIKIIGIQCTENKLELLLYNQKIYLEC
jgi:hypothetical protein